MNLNESGKLAIKEALQRHPDVFMDLIQILQDEAKNMVVVDTKEEEEVVEEVQVSVVRIACIM